MPALSAVISAPLEYLSSVIGVPSPRYARSSTSLFISFAATRYLNTYIVVPLTVSLTAADMGTVFSFSVT